MNYVEDQLPRPTPDPRDRVAAIVIGRNEGATLEDCLTACLSQCANVVYADSESDDDSLEQAGRLPIQILKIGRMVPFRPGAARNLGAQAPLRSPEIEFLQFVDADCVLEPRWVETAVSALDADPATGIVCGTLRERDATASVYKRFLQIEWSRAHGDTSECGGIFMIRAALFRSLDGFRADMVVGEEPELCSRVLQSERGVVRLAVPMAVHESHMVRFRQWWKREMRGGYLDLGIENATGLRPFQQERVSMYRWTLGWLAVTLALAASCTAAFDTIPGVAAGLAGLGLLPAQMARQALRMRRRGHDRRSSLVYGVLVMLQKWPMLIGQLRFRLNRGAAAP